MRALLQQADELPMNCFERVSLFSELFANWERTSSQNAVMANFGESTFHALG
jgi:hypothetical protein